MIADRPGTSEGRQRAVYISAGAIIVAVALSRLYLGLHYPSDVLGGMSAGLAWLSVGGATHRLVASRQAWQPAGVVPFASDLASSPAGSSAEASDR